MWLWLCSFFEKKSFVSYNMICPSVMLHILAFRNVPRFFFFFFNVDVFKLDSGCDAWCHISPSFPSEKKSCANFEFSINGVGVSLYITTSLTSKWAKKKTLNKTNRQKWSHEGGGGGGGYLYPPYPYLYPNMIYFEVQWISVSVTLKKR